MAEPTRQIQFDFLGYTFGQGHLEAGRSVRATHRRRRDGRPNESQQQDVIVLPRPRHRSAL
jgi:hypothetical protein